MSAYRWAYYLNSQGCPLGGVVTVGQEQVDRFELKLGVLEVNGKPVTVVILSDEQAAKLSEHLELVEVETGSGIV